jgi:hypothetical protein
MIIRQRLPFARISEGRGMKNVELYGRVRYAVQIEGLSERAAARRFGIDPRTVSKMMKFSVPPGYVRKKPPARPKLDPFIPVIDRILGDDKSRPKKQQHTAKRIFERLRDEHGFTGGITIVKDYVAGWRQRAQDMFVPLVHPPPESISRSPYMQIAIEPNHSANYGRCRAFASGGMDFDFFVQGQDFSLVTQPCVFRKPRPACNGDEVRLFHFSRYVETYGIFRQISINCPANSVDRVAPASKNRRYRVEPVTHSPSTTVRAS